MKILMTIKKQLVIKKVIKMKMNIYLIVIKAIIDISNE